jgi:hypothetical protein
MAEYHVGCSGITGTIYAGTVKKNGKEWLNKSDVTEEAIAAVRDHITNKASMEKSDFYGYEWTRKDGKKVVLSVSIK